MARVSGREPTSVVNKVVAGRVRRARSTFYWAMRLMGREQRQAIFAVYALARELDDIADEPGAPADKHAALARWRREISLVYDGSPSHPTAQALVAPVRRFGLPQSEFDALVSGMAMDIDGPIRAPSEGELATYCRRVAGSIGLLALPIFGDTSPPAQRFALALAEALQLTNILRDLTEDATRGRLYLPRELLDRFGITASEPVAVLVHPALSHVCATLAEQAEQHFAEAERYVRDADRRRLWPALLMLAAYRRILARLRRGPWPAIDRPRLSSLASLALALRIAILGRP